MELASNISASDLLTLGPRLVGLTFVYAGGIKAIAPHTFHAHLTGLGWLKPGRIDKAVIAAAGLEVGWGLALVVDLASAALYPITIALLIALSTISWWSVRSGRATDCGCYGGFVQPSITQSLGINALFVALVAAAWYAGGSTWNASPLHVWLPITGAIAASVIAHMASRFQLRSGRLLFDTNPLKIGNRWRHGWADGLTRQLSGETLVAFLGPDCPYCAQCVRVGNAVSQAPRLPRVVGVVAATEERRDAFVRENAVKFPVAMISQSLMGRLAQAVPTTVLIKDGKIAHTWVGSAPPPEFVDRVKEAFFPDHMRLEYSATALK